MTSAALSPTAIRLLVLSQSLDRTEEITTSLRNGGLAVHSVRFSQLDQLEEKLQEESFDLVLCCAFEGGIDLGQTQEYILASEHDLPLIVMADDKSNSKSLLEAMRQGARDQVDVANLEHLQLVVAREFDNLQQRRELAAARRRLKETEQRCMGLIENSREAIAFIQDGMHVNVNPAYLELFGIKKRDDVEDLPLLDMIDKNCHRQIRAALKDLESDREKNSITVEAAVLHQEGKTIDASIYLAKASMDGEPCLQVIVRDKNRSSQEMEKKLRRLSRLDSETKLPNRQYFMTQLDHWVDAVRDDAETKAVIYLSVDKFSELRRTLGMEYCDLLVKNIAKTLRKIIARNDLLARFSESTFSLLCRRPSAEDIEGLAESLRAAIEALNLQQQTRLAATDQTCSIGITLITDAHADSHLLINNAYKASEAAREQGGNRVLLYRDTPRTKDEWDTPEPQDGRVIQQIENALENDRFYLVYQPIVSLQGDTRENYAVLLRMHDDAGGELLPELFLKQAERSGRLLEIDRWVIRSAIAALSEQRKLGRKVNMFISLSEPSLSNEDTLLWICDCLREYDARGGWLTFQIKEKHLREHPREVDKLIDGLQKIKCQIAIDHFGLLSDPVALLRRLNVDFIKLAPSFVRELSSNQQKQDELNNLNEMIVENGMKTVATAVEDANSLTVLWTVGVGYIQGYFLQEPSESIEYTAQQLM